MWMLLSRGVTIVYEHNEQGIYKLVAIVQDNKTDGQSNK